MQKNFKDLSEREILALAISLEEEDIRTYSDLAEAMRQNYPGSARMFAAMAGEEDGHRHRLLELYRKKFGDHIPLIRRQDVKGFLERKSFWLLRPLGLEKVRTQVELMEAESKRFYHTAARHSTEAAIRQLLGDLAAEERLHEARAEELEAQYVPAEVEKNEEQAERRLFEEMAASAEHLRPSDVPLLQSYVQATIASRRYARHPSKVDCWEKAVRVQTMAKDRH